MNPRPKNIGDVLAIVRDDIIKPKLNCEIQRINSRYGDRIVLPEVTEKAVKLNLLEVSNITPFVCIEANGIEPRSNKGQVAKVFNLNVFLGLMPINKAGDDDTIACYRYEEAITNTFKNYDCALFDLKYENSEIGAMQRGNHVVYGILCRFSCSIV
ncbi:hypothetical protein Emin_0948 [Elusimicrobium minutum Pei191]|uniref:Uncharacterized protein n=1 Tax=Elusimicrobium minutum (strain Pei191) TaxID=445932 RepID=B2KDA5_ELUMP|nr:hypothetical protein [Elusimicrobium minutum]ACC98501.1 hypothetical protein Emin_0948 [Elusimicrobium minutum Pei191]